MYQIKPLQIAKAKKYGYTIKPSKSKGKKIDVYRNGVKIASIGAVGYKDYATYLKEQSLEYANAKRQQYKARHANDIKKGRGRLSWLILW